MSTFWKYHGLGNDFVLIDHRGKEDFKPAVVRTVCHRHTGVGADGILALIEGRDGRPMMRVFNADGSVADMCGNGLRCFVRWLVEEMGFDARPMIIDTDAGEQECIPVVGAGGAIDTVTINLGGAELRGTHGLLAAGQATDGYELFLANPHFVISRRPRDDEPGTVGPSLSTHDHFLNDTNVEWLEVTSSTSATVVVYERGVGLTQACGTGGAAAAAIGVHLGLLEQDSVLEITQPGGLLLYRVTNGLENVWMTGPATRVYEGRLDLL